MTYLPETLSLVAHRPTDLILFHLQLCSVLPPPSYFSPGLVSCCPHLLLQISFPDWSFSSSAAMWRPLECLLGSAVITPSYSVPNPSPLSSSYLVWHSGSCSVNSPQLLVRPV